MESGSGKEKPVIISCGLGFPAGNSTVRVPAAEAWGDQSNLNTHHSREKREFVFGRFISFFSNYSKWKKKSILYQTMPNESGTCICWINKVLIHS